MNKCSVCWGTGKELNHRLLGREARNRRLARGVGLVAGASLLKLSPAMLSLLEDGKRRWTEKVWEEMKKAYG